MGMPAIEAQNLCFNFRDHQVLRDLSFTIERNQFVSFIGPSGCGKTTLLNILAGIYRNYSGSLDVQSHRISFVFQHDTLLAWRDVLANVLLPFELDGTSPSTRRYEAYEMLSLVGLAGYELFYPHQLSGGMKKRVELARALVTTPDLLILDEPFASLDIITGEKLNILVKKIHADREATAVLVTHSVEEACFLSDKIYVMSNLPSRIFQVKSIPREGAADTDRFLLSEQELIADNEIRKDARSLWNGGQPTKNAPVKEQPDLRSRRADYIASARKWATKHYNLLLIPLELVVVYFVVAFVKERLTIPDYVFPHPGQVLTRLWQTLADGSILVHLYTTIYESLIGFVIAFILTLILGYVIAKSRLLSNLLMPYLVAANTIPSVALAPFLVLWFGFGIAPKIITSVIVIFFPMLMNNISAISLAEEDVRDLVSFYRPKKLKTFYTFELPAALPVIFTGVKVSITLSVIGAVIGEFVSGHQGLGSLVSQAKANFDLELMFVGLIWLIILGLTYFGLASSLFAIVHTKRTPTQKGGKG